MNEAKPFVCPSHFLCSVLRYINTISMVTNFQAFTGGGRPQAQWGGTRATNITISHERIQSPWLGLNSQQQVILSQQLYNHSVTDTPLSITYDDSLVLLPMCMPEIENEGALCTAYFI